MSNQFELVFGRDKKQELNIWYCGSGGIVGQFIGFLACVGGAFLVWTGLSLAWRRFGNWCSKKIFISFAE